MGLPSVVGSEQGGYSVSKMKELSEKGDAYIEDWWVTESSFALNLHGMCHAHHAHGDWYGDEALPIMVRTTRIMGIGDGTIETLNTVYHLGAHRYAKKEAKDREWYETNVLDAKEA